MTVITGRQFRANQSKYIRMAHRGERVILSSRAGYAELTPISEEDKKFDEYVSSKEFHDYAAKVKKEYEAGEGVTLRCAEDIENWFNSL
ncbi:MAG: hypothetical protein IKP36_14425 [Bacteroidaceae bacterium]|nr:hypothetical protein [Bacteroidaceae bacterium]